MLVRTNVNGEWRETDVWPGASLLFMLREHLGLPGSKNACEQGECGSCSVWMDGELVCSCLVLAAQAEGLEVRTVEALAENGDLHPVARCYQNRSAGAAGSDDLALIGHRPQQQGGLYPPGPPQGEGGT